jgi:hypothetical protein
VDVTRVDVTLTVDEEVKGRVNEGGDGRCTNVGGINVEYID